MTTGELRASLPVEPLRILVAVDDACTPSSLCRSVRAHMGDAPLEVFVISPAHGVETQWYVDQDAALAAATRRLRACISCLRRRGIRTEGELGDRDPVQAIGDALATFPADEILIVTGPQRPSPWLHRTLVDRVRHVFAQPVAHVVVPDLEPRIRT